MSFFWKGVKVRVGFRYSREGVKTHSLEMCLTPVVF